MRALNHMNMYHLRKQDIQLSGNHIQMKMNHIHFQEYFLVQSNVQWSLFGANAFAYTNYHSVHQFPLHVVSCILLGK